MTPGRTGIPAAVLAVLGAWALGLVLAPPDSNFVWALNGLRSAPPESLLAAAAVAFATLAHLRKDPRLEWPVVAAFALVLAFALRERAHLVGDTALRQRLLEALTAPGARLLSTAALARTLHCQPLDALVSVGAPAALARAGVPAPVGVALVGAALFPLLHAGLRRALGGDTQPLAPVLAAAAACSGLLVLYAGYADGLALTLALAAWWWSALDRPLGTTRAALAAAGLWLALACSHRLGWVLLAPVAWRVWDARAGDSPRARAWLAGGTAVAAAAAFALARAIGGGPLGQDFADLANSLAGSGGPRLVAAPDLLNGALLVLPLALLAPLLAGREACAAFARSPSGPLFAAALVPLLPLLLVFPVAPHGLGAHRDWDLGALPGLLASLAGARVLAHAGPARVRLMLLVAVPVLALQAGGWLAVNASPAAGEARARQLVDGAGAMRDEPASQVHVLLAYRAADAGDFVTSARRFERAAAVLPNPRHELLAAQAWLAAGDPYRAHAAYARALGYAPFSGDVARTAALVARALGQAPPPARR